MRSDFHPPNKWLPDADDLDGVARALINTRGATAVPAKVSPGLRTPTWSTSAACPFVMATHSSSPSCLGHGFAPAPPCQDQRIAKSRSSLLDLDTTATAHPLSTASSDPSLHVCPVTGFSAEEGAYVSTELVGAPGEDTGGDVDSETESDASRFFSDYDSDDNGRDDTREDDRQGYSSDEGEDGDTYSDEEPQGGNWLDGDNDTAMTLEPLHYQSSTSPFVSPPGLLESALAAFTRPESKPRRCKPSPKKVGFQRSTEGDDIDMAEQGDNDESSADEEDIEGYSYTFTSWLGGSYNPLWLGRVISSGKKRRDFVRDEDDEDRAGCANGEVSADVEKRRFRQPSLTRRKRVLKAGAPSSVAESEWSLPVLNPSSEAVGTAIATSTQIPWELKQKLNNPSRALGRRLENLRVEGDACIRRTETTPSIPPTLQNSSDCVPNKRPRYLSSPTPEAGTGEITPLLSWDIVEEPVPISMTMDTCHVPGLDVGMGMGLDMDIDLELSSLGMGDSQKQNDLLKTLERVDQVV